MDQTENPDYLDLAENPLEVETRCWQKILDLQDKVIGNQYELIDNQYQRRKVLYNVSKAS